MINQVFRLKAEFDTSFKQWRERLLPQIAHSVVDASSYIKVRIDESVRDCAVLTAIGVRPENGRN